ncbi:MAG: orotidine-5'-phosphate decarboxylase [Rhodospirillales bacterium]|nr:orotidine-5'-phosphate decarboxylase [Rhodospirillales bacterium]
MRTTTADMASRIFVALDTPDADTAADIAGAVRGAVGGIKLGKEFFTANGPDGVERVCKSADLPLFLDLKFHDIPNTVAGAVRATLAFKPLMVNVHAAGGAEMMRAAASAAAEAGSSRPMVLGVTVLTSLDNGDLADTGVAGPTADQVVRLARLAQDCGLDGVVCSAREIVALRNACGGGFKLVVPGIRPAWSTSDDQRRIVTPVEALALGADYLVTGRPITAADDPAAAAGRIVREIAEAA